MSLLEEKEPDVQKPFLVKNEIEPTPGPIVQCHIVVHGTEFQCCEKRAMTEAELESYVQGIVKDGYATYPSDRRNVFYPPHTIRRIEITYP